MRERFRRILDSCRPYLVTSPCGPFGPTGIEDLPLGLRSDQMLQFNPLEEKSGPFLNALHKLDELTFGPVGMPMPRWVFYDCAEVPGGIFGFARPALDVPLWVRYALEIGDDYRGPVPLSMYVAIPMLEPGCWHTYTLCSMNDVASGAGPAGLGLLSAAVALHVFPIETAYGTTQWRSRRLATHARFGPLELVTAWTPAHSDPTTLTFRVPVTPERIDRALSPDEPVALGDVRWIDCDEPSELRTLQDELESGRRFDIVGAPVVEGSFTRVPVREVPA